MYNIGIHQLPSARLTIKQCSRSIKKQMLNLSLGLIIFYTISVFLFLWYELVIHTIFTTYINLE